MYSAIPSSTHGSFREHSMEKQVMPIPIVSMEEMKMTSILEKTYFPRLPRTTRYFA